MKPKNARREGSQNRQFDLALSYAEGGWQVFPACARTKRPLTQHSFYDATSNSNIIRNWWCATPSALVAIPTGQRTGIWVLDVDGTAGRSSLAELMQRFGVELLGDLSPLITTTPGRGLHIYFKLRPGETPRSRAGDIGLGLDTRGEGGYIIAPGNVLPDGRRYQRFTGGSLS